MILRLSGKDSKSGKLIIENLRHYPAELVEKLHRLLAQGVEAQPDPRRKGFYDLDSGTRVFFIHISPVSGNVILLASWLKEREQAAEAIRVHAASQRSDCMTCAGQAA